MSNTAFTLAMSLGATFSRLIAIRFVCAVIPFGWRSTERHLRKLLEDSGLGNPKIEIRGLEKPLITDSGHYLLDCHLEKIPDPECLGEKLNQIPGIVEHGLFIGIATDAVVGHASGETEVLSFRS